MISIPVEYMELAGKKWIFVQASMILQCAYCLYVNPLRPIRDEAGLVVKLEVEHEEHHRGCPQYEEGES